MHQNVDVVVIGAGISGLATAFWLHKSGFSVLVLEKELIAGGCIQTRHEQGFLIEQGPNSTLETNPVIGQLVDALGLRQQLLYANPEAKRRYVMRDGRLHPIPMSPPAFLTTPLFSLKAKIRVFKEFFVGRSNAPDETVADFVTRRLGPEFLDYAINPFVAGVYAGDPKQLSVRSAFPKLVALEDQYGGIFKGVIKGRKERKKRAQAGEESKQSAKMFSFQEGMQVLPQTIATALGSNLRTGAQVLGIQSHQGAWEVSYNHEEQQNVAKTWTVLFAAPAYATAELIKHLSSDTAHTLKEIPYARVVMAFLGYTADKIPRSMDGFGYLIPEKEKRNSLGTLWSNSIFPGRAPQGQVALTNFLGGARSPALIEEDDETILNLLKIDLKNSMDIQTQPDFVFVRRWPRAIPQYTLGHSQREEVMATFEQAFPGLFITGNHRGGISVADCIGNSQKVADKIAASIKSHVTP